MQQQVDIWRPALISGAIFGFIAGVPFVNLLNCLCCSLILGAGVMSSLMMVRASAGPLGYGRAALGGFVAGVVAAPASTVASSLFSILMGTNVKEQIEQSSRMMEQYLPDAGEASRVLASIPAIMITLMVTLILVVVFAPFGAIGGVIGRAIFERRTPAPAPPPPVEPPT